VKPNQTAKFSDCWRRKWVLVMRVLIESDDEMASQAFHKNDERAIHFDWASLKKTGWQKVNVNSAICRRRFCDTIRQV
jgi:hypothetical protein